MFEYSYLSWIQKERIKNFQNVRGYYSTVEGALTYITYNFLKY